MAMTMHVDIVSAESSIFSGTATALHAPATLGEVGILPRHSPLLTSLQPGEIRVVTGDQEEAYYVSGGLLEVQPHRVTVLADTVLRARNLDEAAAMEAKARAEQSLQDHGGEVDYARAQAELAEAVAQLQTIQRLRRRRGESH